MVITLIGYRGSGKSTVATPLAAKFGLKPVDADTEIEAHMGRSIASVFEDDGEPAFRMVERDVMATLLGRDGVVIAAGGGAVLDDDTRTLAREKGPVVYLRADGETLAARIGGDAATASRRPALAGGADPVAEVDTVLAERTPVYEAAATVVVDVDGRDVPDIVAEIAAKIWRRPAGYAAGAAE
ncbi:MAG: shikimate kinase [Planctomycetota bacterium]